MLKRYIAIFMVVLLAVLLIPALETQDAPVFAMGTPASPPPAATPEPAPTPGPTAPPAPIATLAPVPTAAPASTPAPIAQGASGDEVRKVQQVLYLYGFSENAPDGIFGPATAASVLRLKEYINTCFSAGEPNDGAISRRLYNSLDTMPASAGAMQRGDTGVNVSRMQRRLKTLGYLAQEPDGNYGENTERAVAYFQTRNGLFCSGVATEETQGLLFSAEANGSDKHVMPYKLVVDVGEQKVHAYSWSGGAFTNLVRSMTCSTGTKANPTPLGTFSNTTGRGARWHYFRKWECWAQYAYYIEGDILFHSVLFSRQDESAVTKSSVRNLGKRASHGCVRLAVEDAKWIWENCPRMTTVIVQE